MWLQSLRGRKVVLHFFPKASVAASAEARRYRARGDELKALGIEIIGASADDAAAQGKFATQNRVSFPLLSDEEGTIAKSYGAALLERRSSRGVAFVIDEAGAVEAVFERAEQVLGFLRDSAEKTQAASPRSSLRSLVSREGVVVQGRYQLKTLVGRGGLGEVWRAEHLHLKREVALKILTDPPDGDGDAGEGWIESCVRRFRFEAQVSALLGARTRHVVSVFDAGYDPVGPYLAMEFVQGRALDQEIVVRGAFTPKDLAPILDQLGDALAAAHREGIVHRDLKPANVMLQREPNGGVFVKLTDFGIAKASDISKSFDRPKDTAVTQLVGTPEYMSPEQLRGAGNDVRIDVWAFGALVYEALTGVVPFDAATTPELILKIVRTPHEPPSSIAPLPKGLDAWMDRALAKDPDARFRSIAEAVQAYHEAIVERPSVTELHTASTQLVRPSLAPRETRSAAPVEAPTSQPTSTSALRRSWLVVAAIAIAGVAMTAALWGFRGRDPAPLPDATRSIEQPRSAAQDAPSRAPPPAEEVAPVVLPHDDRPPPKPSADPVSDLRPNVRRTNEPASHPSARSTPRRGRDPSATF